MSDGRSIAEWASGVKLVPNRMPRFDRNESTRPEIEVFDVDGQQSVENVHVPHVQSESILSGVVRTNIVVFAECVASSECHDVDTGFLSRNPVRQDKSIESEHTILSVRFDLVRPESVVSGEFGNRHDWFPLVCLTYVKLECNESGQHPNSKRRTLDVPNDGVRSTVAECDSVSVAPVRLDEHVPSVPRTHDLTGRTHVVRHELIVVEELRHLSVEHGRVPLCSSFVVRLC